MKHHPKITKVNKLLRYIFTFSFLLVCGLLIIGSIPVSAQTTLVCDPQIYYGVKHCTDDGGFTHILLVDLNDPHVRLETVLSMGPSGECNSVNTTIKDPTSNCPYPYPLETIKSMLERYQSRGAVAAINTDYFALDQDHGAQGLAVKNGVRLDGLEHGVTTDIPYNFPSLAISDQNHAIIGIPGSNTVITENTATTYKNTAAGAPIIVGGERYGNEACSVNVYPGLKCTQLSQSGVGITSDGRLVFITAQKDATGLANYLTLNYQVHTALKFDGGGSASIAWLDKNSNAQFYYSDITSTRAVAEGLLIFSERIQATTTVDVALIIDSSGSMTWNDPYNKRLDAAKAYLTGSYYGDYVGVIDFDSYARLASPLRRIPDFKNLIIDAINTIDSSGGTNIGVGIALACDALKASTSDNYTKGAILLTDGVGAFNNQDQCFIDQHWPIYTFGFGGADVALLTRIATNTGGEFTWLPTSDLICEFQRVRAKIANVEPDPCMVYHVLPLEITVFTIGVEDGQEQITISISWTGSDVELSLISPSGRVIDRNTSDSDVVHDLGSTYEIYTILNPEPGEWQVSLYGADVPIDGEDVVFGFTSIPSTSQPPTITAPSQQTVQYSDLLEFQISATDPDDLAETLVFTAAGLPDGIAFADNGDGTATVSGIAALPPGAYDVDITVSDPEGLSASVTVQINVEQEDARTTYTGPMLVSTPCTDCTTATVPLRATVQDITAVLGDPAYDEYPGDITYATVTFFNRETNAVLCAAPVTLFDPLDPTTGTAYCEWVADIGANDGYDFNLGILVDGYYTRNTTADDVIVVVSKPSTNSITGGGYLLNGSTSGTYAGDLDLRTHFGFNIKFINNHGRGQSIVGRATVIVRQDGHIYRIRTNALESLAVVPASNDTPAVGEFYSKASIEDVTDANNPILLTSQAFINFTMTDYEEASGQYRDLLGVTVWDRNGSLLFSSNWTGTQTIEQAIEAGNLEIHQFTSQPR